jgi:hypothetical protein
MKLELSMFPCAALSLIRFVVWMLMRMCILPAFGVSTFSLTVVLPLYSCQIKLAFSEIDYSRETF